MQLSSRFPVAIQILILIAWTADEYKITSDIIAKSVNTNPVMIRRIVGSLKKSGLVLVSPGKRGIKLTRKTDEITLLDVYQAMELTGHEPLFGMHPDPNLRCPIGSKINEVMTPHFDRAIKSMEESLASVTIEKLMDEFPPFYIPEGFDVKNYVKDVSK